MKFTLLLCVALFFQAIMLDAQQVYFTDGDKWEESITSSWSLETLRHVNVICGDSIINDTIYHKVYSKTEGDLFETVSLIRQDDKKIFYRDDNLDLLLYDFGLNVGDTFESNSSLTVTSVDSVIIDEEWRKTIHFGYPFDGGEQRYWIEGIGSSRAFYHFNTYVTDTYFESCCFSNRVYSDIFPWTSGDYNFYWGNTYCVCDEPEFGGWPVLDIDCERIGYYAINVQSPSCFGMNNGVISITNLNPNSELFLWEDGFEGTTRANLEPGIYNVSVIENDGYIDVLNILVEETDILDVNILFEYGSQNIEQGDSVSFNLAIFNGSPPFSYTWSIDEEEQDSLNFVFYPDSTSTYYLSLTDSEGCSFSDSLEIIVYPYINVNELADEVFLSLYPNPTFGKLNIEIKPSKHNVEILILNSIGVVCLQNEFELLDQQELELDLPSGTYVLVIMYDAGIEYYQRFVVY